MDGPGLHYIRASYGKQAAQVAAGQSRMLRSKPPAEAQACAHGIINSVLDAGTPQFALHPSQCNTASATPSVVLKPLRVRHQCYRAAGCRLVLCCFL